MPGLQPSLATQGKFGEGRAAKAQHRPARFAPQFSWVALAGFKSGQTALQGFAIHCWLCLAAGGGRGVLQGASGVNPLTTFPSAGSAGKVGWLEHPELAWPFLKSRKAPETRQAAVGMPCPVPADQGVAQAGLVDAKEIVLHLPHFFPGFLQFPPVSLNVNLLFDTKSIEKMINYSFCRLCSSSISYLIKVHVGSFFPSFFAFQSSSVQLSLHTPALSSSHLSPAFPGFLTFCISCNPSFAFTELSNF